MNHHNNSHQVKVANHGMSGIWVNVAEIHPVSSTMYSIQKEKSDTRYDFLGKSFDE